MNNGVCTLEALAHLGSISKPRMLVLLGVTHRNQLEWASPWNILDEMSRYCYIEVNDYRSQILARKPTLNVVPRAGPRVAVVTGCYTRAWLTELLSKLPKHGATGKISTSGPSNLPLVTVCAPSGVELGQVAKEMAADLVPAGSIPFDRDSTVFPCDIWKAGEWRTHGHAQQERRDFSPTSLLFGGQTNDRVRLSMYQNEVTRQWTHCLVKDGRERVVDRRTGIHALLAYNGTQIVAFDFNQKTITVPLRARLPLPLERLAFLTSGRPPHRTRMEIGEHTMEAEQFVEVPTRVASFIREACHGKEAT